MEYILNTHLGVFGISVSAVIFLCGTGFFAAGAVAAAAGYAWYKAI